MRGGFQHTQEQQKQYMSSYSSFLTNSNINNHSQLTNKSTTPKKYSVTTPNTPLENSKHLPDRPPVQNYSTYRPPEPAKFKPVPFRKPDSQDNFRLYNSNHQQAPKHNPQLIPSIRVIPQQVPPSPTRPLKRQFKARKGSENNIAFESKLSSNIQTKEGSHFFISEKERRGSCHNLLMHEQQKRPRLSMMDEIKYSDSPPAPKMHKKQWNENNDFVMEETDQTNESDMLILPKKSYSHHPQSKSNEHKQGEQNIPSDQKERKHSDNQAVKKQPPSFLTGQKNTRRYSMIPQKKWTIERFKIIKELGKGAYGRVVLAMEKETGFACAIKILSKRDLQEENMIEQFTREIKIQCYFKHPNIVKVYGFFDDLLHLYVLMECALDHRLSDILAEKRLGQAEAATVFYQLCSAVCELHIDSVIHRDLKPQNIIFHEGVVKVCDFGWSVYRGSQLRTTFCGTPLYLSPQILVGDSYDESVDVWALGITLYEIVFGGNPFDIKEAKDLVNIVHEHVDLNSKNLSAGLRQILAACLRKKGEDRPTLKWLLGREWVRKGRPEEYARIAVNDK